MRKKVILFPEVSCAAFDYDGSFATVGFVYDENYLLLKVVKWSSGHFNLSCAFDKGRSYTK